MSLTVHAYQTHIQKKKRFLVDDLHFSFAYASTHPTH
jgi:hypothetical protein